MTVLVALLGLIFLIVIHELGHMLTAKALGVRVPEFAVGFGPPLDQEEVRQDRLLVPHNPPRRVRQDGRDGRRGGRS